MPHSPHTSIHFIGIGGIGMSGLAEILLSMGYKVSGSDLTLSPITEKLASLGATIKRGHERGHLKDATVVVYSSAIPPDNPEILAAKERPVPLMKRAEMLAELMRSQKGVAVAGTHGKTTTTSILATILRENHLHPTYIIGGVVHNLKGHAQKGTGQILVAEADESDGSFLLLNPFASIITNIDTDHLDHYRSKAHLSAAFETFANQVPFDGLCALNIHDPCSKEMTKVLRRPFTTFGLEGRGENPEFMASKITSSRNAVHFILSHKGEHTPITLAMPGEHNVLNVLGAMAIAHHMGLTLSEIARGVAKFEGVGRRFQTIFDRDSLEIIDDYGHHPTEIKATIQTLKQSRQKGPLIVFFEPHRYSRTRDCWESFLDCFQGADKVYMAPIYPAGEAPISGISSIKLATEINTRHPGLVEPLPSMEDMKRLLSKKKGHPQVVLSLGAGSVGRVVQEWVQCQNRR